MDRIIRTITKNGSIMAAAVDSSEIVMTAQSLHNLTRTTAAALGRLLSAASLMGSMMKSEKGRLTLKVNGGGPIGSLVAVSDPYGNVRGYVDNPGADLPLRPDGKIDVGGGVGAAGRIAVMRDFGERDPYIGQVELVSGEIAEDITGYYAQSEQIPTVCALGVLVDKSDGKAMLSGGLLIQALPGATDEELSRLEENIGRLDSVTTMLAKGMSLEEMCGAAMSGFEIEKLDELEVHYVCSCSKERFSRALMTLGSEEILSLPLNENGVVETVCQFCGRKYCFSEDDLRAIANEAQNNKKQ